MKADQIIKNAKIFTADRNKPLATALAVKDGKFVYVGDKAGLSEYEGEVRDLGGRFIMPGIIDSHVHVTKGPVLSIRKRYRFVLERKFLHEDDITKEDLDAICPHGEIVIMESEAHSVWASSIVLEQHGITDDTPDPNEQVYQI